MTSDNHDRPPPQRPRSHARRNMLADTALAIWDDIRDMAMSGSLDSERAVAVILEHLEKLDDG